MSQHTSVYRTIVIGFLTSVILFVGSCETVEKESSLVLSPKVDSILHDTAHVGYIVDSLRKEYFKATADTQRINILNDLSQQYRANARVLAQEAIAQSKKLNYQYGLADGLCKRGIEYYRHAEYDSARILYDQCKVIAEQINSDKLIAQSMGWTGDAYRMEGNSERALYYLQRAEKLADSCGAKSVSGFCLSGMGSMYYINGEYEKSIEYTNKALLVAAETQDKFRMGFCLASLGKVYNLQGNYVAAISTFSQALEIAKTVENKTLISFCLNSIGDIYRHTDDTAQARKYFLEALDMAREIDDKARTAYALSYLGDIAREEGKPEQAITYYRMAIPIATEADDSANIIYSYNGIGDAFHIAGQFDSAIYFFNVSKSLCDSLEDGEQIANNNFCIARTYYKMNKLPESEKFVFSAFEAAKEIQLPEYERDCAELLYLIYKATNRPAKALEMHEYCVSMNDSIVNLETVRRFAEEEYNAKENQMRSEQAEKDAVALQIRLAKEVELENQKYISYAVAGIGLLALVCLVIAIRGYRIKRRANEAIQQQKLQVEHQKEIIEEKNKEIVDSINYAQRIQNALFPPEKKVNEVFGESFVLFMPKDIVSGDFYWMETAKDGSSLLAAVDCTGHGVPGALVSVVGNNALNRTVREFGLSDPGKILNKLNELVEETFAQSDNDVKDGMDLSLLSITEREGKKELKWAGANNNLWMIRNKVLMEIKANRQSIGKSDDRVEFETHKLALEPNDIIYIFTDGFADQFGGPKGKKYKYKGLQELLLSLHQLDTQTQKVKLHAAFEEWRGHLEQVDDVLVIGVKIS
jgi:serine phosphatase RsbU (regulator of sigma subunit)/tetratricopeptide (TPR) repeat protein